MHARSEEFDATELRRARPSLETIDLRALEFGPDYLRSASTTSECVTHLHISVPTYNNSWYARAYPRVKNEKTKFISVFQSDAKTKNKKKNSNLFFDVMRKRKKNCKWNLNSIFPRHRKTFGTKVQALFWSPVRHYL